MDKPDPVDIPRTATQRARAPRSAEELRRWQAGNPEPVLEPGIPIIDPHHHLWDRPGHPYLLPEFLADAGCGHDIRATVFVECGAMYRASGPAEMKPVGETEFVSGMAAMSASGLYGPTAVCAGIVSFADLTLGPAVQEVLDAHVAAGGGRLRGIRHQSAHDESLHWEKQKPKGLLRDARLRAGLARLVPMGLVFDAWVYFTQLGDVADLARSSPGTPIVLNHLGGVLGVGAHEGRLGEEFSVWKCGMKNLATCENVVVKVGGLGMLKAGLGAALRETPASSCELAASWRPYVETCIEMFGAERCMFESDFPPDKQSCSYSVLWNAFKRLASSSSTSEKTALFHDTAARVYQLPPAQQLSALPAASPVTGKSGDPASHR